MEITKEQELVLERLARISGIPEFTKKEFGDIPVTTSVGTVVTSVAGLAAGSLTIAQPWSQGDLELVASQVGSIFITMVNLCSSLGVDPLSLIDLEFQKQKEGLAIQRRAMEAMRKTIESGKLNSGPIEI